ncbi:MAG: hypothetical protein GYA14_14535 [Ignavibacteria bacterium]|nr:hypothetical protein [Ignavibacteria bacterium]
MIAIALKSLRYYLLNLLTSMAETLTLRLKRVVRQHTALFIKKQKYLNHLDIAIALEYSRGITVSAISNRFNLHKRTIYRRIRKVKIHTGCFTNSAVRNYLQGWIVL